MAYIFTSIIFVSIIIITSWLIVFYNKMIHIKTKADRNWAALYYQLKIWSDLIPKYVALIQEDSNRTNPEIFEKIIIKRYKFILIHTSEQAKKFFYETNELLDELFSSIKNSNNINKKILEYQTNIKKHEIKINKTYKDYDESVLEFNKFLSKFPNKIAANILGINRLEYFQSNLNK